MKKIRTLISRRTLLATAYALGGLTFLASLFGLLFISWIVLPADLPGKERVLVLGYSIASLVIIISVTFVAGCDFERKALLGRPIGVQGLLTPGTWLPQSEGFFRILNKHELGGGMAMGTFLQVEKVHLATGAPTKARFGQLFCVITPSELIPDDPQFVKLTYDQRCNLKLTVLSDQSYGAN